jgi:EAL domain-containing protein (putative c-di-GMP-specific phosphodiesterase class I)
MARALGMGVIPEGVETEGQLERLSAIGCDHAQGFLLSRPLPAERLEALVRGADVTPLASDGDASVSPPVRRPA